MLEEQWWKIQRRNEEEQLLQAQLKEAAEACHVKCTAQKARKVAKAKTREEVKKWRLVEKKEKKQQIEYLRQLWDEVLAKDTTLLVGTEAF